MDYHQNARLTMHSREQMARMVLSTGCTLKAAAAEFKVSPKTASKWVRRYQAQGAAGLRDLSSRPHRSPRQTPSVLLEKVLSLRRQSMPGYQIALRCALSCSTVSRMLRRAGLSRWRDLHPRPPIVRYEHAAPGDLVHLDIKSMTRFGEVSLRGWAAEGQARASRPAGPPCRCR